MEPHDVPNAIAADEKECPFCFERIKARAIVCRFCGRDLESTHRGASGTGRVRREEIFGMLLSLGDKSLVTSEHERTRYRLLETVRQYLREKLLHTEEAAAIRDRHLSLFADFAERQAKDDFGRGMPTAFRNLDSEQDNLRRALVWSLESPRHLDAGLRLCVALSHYWVARGLVAEGLDWTAKLVERCENSPAPPRLHVLAMLIAGSYLIHQRGPVAARPTIERAFNLAVKLGDPMVLGEIGRAHV